MEKQWPVRWDLLQRYRLIEIIALWEGRLTTRHLSNAFGIGRQQASRDINEYLRDIGPDNLIYDPHRKGYTPSAQFKPRVTAGLADEYLQLLNRQHDLALRFENLARHANTEVLSVPCRQLEPALVRQVVGAARYHQRLQIQYASLASPVAETRIISPHTLVHTGMRWHLRAFCEKNGDYRDFVLSRLRGDAEIIGDSSHRAADDRDWQTEVEIQLRAHSRFNDARRAIVEHDFGMRGGRLIIATRGPLVQYTLQLLQADAGGLSGGADSALISLANKDELLPWLY